jgi:glutamate transport system substrate-binding protein
MNRTLRTSAVLVVLTFAPSACGSTKTVTPSATPTTVAGAPSYDSIIQSAPVAAASDIASGSWAASIKQRGYVREGGTDAGPLFSIRDIATGKLTGFDAGLAQMLSHYITGKSDVQSLTKLTNTTVDTRETLLQNGTVDAVFATYTITPARATKVDFAGPYYESGDAIMVKSGNTAINSVSDLNGRTVATESNSTAALALPKYAPTAKITLFQQDAECVAAVQQGRVDAYVLDQGILISDASTNPAVKVVGQPFTQEPYGIGLPKSDPTAKPFVNAWLQKIFDNGDWAKLWKATVGTVVKGNPPTPPTIGSAAGS